MTQTLTDSQLDRIETQLKELQASMDRVEALIAKADATIAKVAVEVMPTVEALMDNPLVKGLTFGKKKR